MKVDLCIPHYNSPYSLRKLVSQAKELGVNKIFILDDFSSAKNVESLKRIRFKQVSVVYGDRNIGAGGNRNRVIGLSNADILLFIDCDIEIISKNTVSVVRDEFVDNDGVGVVGLKILNNDGSGLRWNYGHKPSFVNDIIENIAVAIFTVCFRDRRVGVVLDRFVSRYTYAIEILMGRQERRVVDWVAEGAFAVRRGLFEQIGGFEDELRYHEIQIFAKKVRDLGYRIVFTPAASVSHLDIQVRANKWWDKLSSRVKLHFWKF